MRYGVSSCNIIKNSCKQEYNIGAGIYKDKKNKSEYILSDIEARLIYKDDKDNSLQGGSEYD